MAAVVQWLERRVVVPNVMGSNPIGRPTKIVSTFHLREAFFRDVHSLIILHWNICRRGRTMVESKAIVERTASVTTIAFFVFEFMG